MTTHPDIEAIAALDWTAYACQCPCHLHGCVNRATHIVEIHALHRCNTPGLNPFGNRIEIRCHQCLLRLRAQVLYQLTQVNQWGIGECAGCAAPIATVRDVVRDWRPL